MTRVLLILLCAFMLLASVFYLTGSTVRDRALASADRTLAERAQFIADSVDRTMQQRMVQVFTFAALSSMRGFAASDEVGRPARTAMALAELQAIVSADPNVHAVSIVDQSGVVNLATHSALMNVDGRDRLFVREALAGKLHASTPVREFGELSQFYSAPILNNSGEVAGALILRVAVQEMWGALGKQADVLVVDENGVRLADQSSKPLMLTALSPLPADAAARAIAEQRYGAEVTQISATDWIDLTNALKRSEINPVVYRNAQGQTYRAALRRLKTNPWTVIAFTAEDAALAPARESIVDQITLSVTVIVVLLAAVAIYAARFPARPRESNA